MNHPGFGSLSFQTESSISLNLVRPILTSRSLYPIGEWEYSISYQNYSSIILRAQCLKLGSKNPNVTKQVQFPF